MLWYSQICVTVLTTCAQQRTFRVNPQIEEVTEYLKIETIPTLLYCTYNALSKCILSYINKTFIHYLFLLYGVWPLVHHSWIGDRLLTVSFAAISCSVGILAKIRSVSQEFPVFRNLRIQYHIVETGIWFSWHHALQDCPLVWKSWIRSDHNASFSSFFIMIQFLSCSEVIVSEKCSEKQIRMITYLPLSRKRIPLNQNGYTADFRIGVPFVRAEFANFGFIHPSDFQKS